MARQYGLAYAFALSLVACAGVRDADIAHVGRVRIEMPAGEPVAVAILVADKPSGDEATKASEALARRGVLVINAATKDFIAASGKGSRPLAFSRAVARLSQTVERKAGLRSYRTPVVVGIGMGAAVARMAAAQMPAGLAAGFVAVGDAHSIAASVVPAHGAGLDGKWIAPGRFRMTAMPETAQPLATVATGNGEPLRIASAVLALQTRSAREAMASSPSEGLTADLPLTAYPVAAPAAEKRCVIFLSGDGGWAGFDRDTSRELARAGNATVGWDMLDYLWNGRKPQEMGGDLDRVVAALDRAWHCPRYTLVGYSYGADIAPFMLRAATPRARQRIDAVVLMGLSPKVDLTFHVTSWLGQSTAAAMPTLPEIRKLRAASITCIMGDSEGDSACAQVRQPNAVVRVVPGGHHFSNDHQRIARIIGSAGNARA